MRSDWIYQSCPSRCTNTFPGSDVVWLREADSLEHKAPPTQRDDGCFAWIQWAMVVTPVFLRIAIEDRWKHDCVEV